ncbi:MAG: MmgE/PrpD family protein, partial [Butyrivibrio sp.]|nr:MmgE/PrpD family protein [Butyrivibrio sp.]
AAVVRVTTKDGRIVEDRVDYPKGEPENPLSDEEFRERYNGLMAYAGISPKKSSEIYDLVYKRGVMAKEIVSQL